MHGSLFLTGIQADVGSGLVNLQFLIRNFISPQFVLKI